MTSEAVVERVVVDLRQNVLVLELDRALGDGTSTGATIDIGALGRLIGVEVADNYLAISDPVPGSELQGRSVEIEVRVEPDRRRIVIPRSGETWELSFPSGNQCWNRRNRDGGTSAVCAVVADT